MVATRPAGRRAEEPRWRGREGPAAVYRFGVSLSPDRELRRSFSAVVAALAAVAAVAGSVLVAPGPAGADASGNAKLTLLSQSQWVTPPQAGGTATFTLGLSATGAPAGSKVVVSLYSRLITRSAFETDLRASPSQLGRSQNSTAPAVLTQLPAPTGGGGGHDLKINVVPSSSAATPPSPWLSLGCTATSICTGVYPVLVSLESSSGSDLAHFTTFLTYASPSTAKLNFAWVVPLTARTSIRPGATQPKHALTPLAPTTASRLEQLIGELHSTDVPVTLEPAAETVQALVASGTKGSAAVKSTLASMSADPSVDQVVTEGYVPFGLGALAAAGEPTEITAQVQTAQTALKDAGLQPGNGTTWVATGRVGTAIATGLAQVHATHVVVPATQLAPSTTRHTWASTFQLSVAGGSPVGAAASDHALASQFAVHGDPVLAATQLLADLAMVHAELPNTGQRGLIAVPPSGWRPTRTFDRTLLKGLQGNPVVQPVTLSRFFSSVAPSTTTPTRRLATSSSGPSLSSSLAHQISTARLRLTAFDGAVTKRTAVPMELAEALLTAEASYHGRRGMAAQVSAYKHLFNHQLSLVQLSSTDGSITLTARTGTIPITVVSSAPYTIRGVLTLSSSKFKFPKGTTQTLALVHPANSVRVPVVARTLGDSPVTVTFAAPGGLVIASGQVVVRSTATSVVGVVLTAAALAILLGWWARTWRTGRRRRRTPTGTGRRA